MSDELFDLMEFAPPTPSWAEKCFYCFPDGTGYYNEANHLSEHLPLTCSVCGDVSPNRLMFEMNHCITLGGSWQRDALVCTSLNLRLNHLVGALRNGEPLSVGAQAALDLGWTVVDDVAVAPAGWPGGSHATVCRAVAA